MGWSIRKKLIIFLMAASVLPFGSAIAITYYCTTDSLNDRSVLRNQEVIGQGKEDITTYFKEVAQMPTILYRYTPFMNVLKNGVSGNLSNNQEEINRILVYLFNTRYEMEQMHLYIHEGQDSYTIYHSTLSGRGKYGNVDTHPYYHQLSRSDGFTTIEPPHEIYSYNNLSFIPNSEKKEVLSFHNIIRDVPSDKPLAFFSIDINFKQLSSIADRLYAKEEDFYIMDEDDRIVYSSDEKLIGTENDEEWFQQVKQESSSGKSLEWEDNHFSGVIVHEQFSDELKDWHIVKRTPYDLIYQSARETAFINILIGLATLVVVVLATMVVSFRFTAPIKVLIDNMKKVEKGEFKAEFDSLGNDEFGMLGRNFKLMITTINNLIQREYKLEIENKTSQLRVLQSQINPHFLYNALQSIGTLALKHKAVQVYSLLTALSKIMRYSMNIREDIVPLAAEIQHVNAYLSLQKQRFDERFEFELNIQKEAEAIHIPKMVLQPIVENCFKHGFDQQEGKACIHIDACLTENGAVRIAVKDNGRGLNEEQIRSLRQELFDAGFVDGENKNEAIGLKNIYDRLQIYYNDNAKMTINSEENNGFMVMIELPNIMNKEDSLHENINC